MLKLNGICKTYRTSEVETLALNEVSLEIGGGEFVAIMGPSGCGKSTLLGVLGLLDSPTSGEYWFFGEDVARLPEKRLTGLRRDRIGFVFQSFNLIDDLTVAENVEVALLYRRVPAGERRRRVGEALERSAWPTAPAIARSSSPAASSSGWRWRGRWSRSPA